LVKRNKAIFYPINLSASKNCFVFLLIKQIKMINEEPTVELLPVSGLQHFLFCPRQWALIHLEQIWAENYLTRIPPPPARRRWNNSPRTKRTLESLAGGV